jgi:Helix-turn-helix domain
MEKAPVCVPGPITTLAVSSQGRNRSSHRKRIDELQPISARRQCARHRVDLMDPAVLWAIRDDRTLSEHAKFAYLMLYSRGEDIRPSTAQLAADMGVSKPTAKRALRELETAGHLKRLPRISDVGDPDTNTYVLSGFGVGSERPQVGSHRPQGGVTQTPGVGSHRPQGGVTQTPEVKKGKVVNLKVKNEALSLASASTNDTGGREAPEQEREGAIDLKCPKCQRQNLRFLLASGVCGWCDAAERGGESVGDRAIRQGAALRAKLRRGREYNLHEPSPTTVEEMLAP